MIKRNRKKPQNIDKKIQEPIQSSTLSTEERLKVIANIIIDKLVEINQSKLKS